MGTVGIVTEIGLLVPVPMMGAGVGNVPVGRDSSTTNESELVNPPDTEKCTSNVAPVHIVFGRELTVRVQGGKSVSAEKGDFAGRCSPQRLNPNIHSPSST